MTLEKKTLPETANEYLLMGIAASLPFSIVFNSYLIIAWVVNALVFLPGPKFPSSALRNRVLPLYVGFYLLHIIGLLWTQNTETGLKDLETKLSLLAFPLGIGAWLRLKESDRDKVLWVFVGACTLGSLLCYGNAFYRFSLTGETKYFFYHELGGFIDMHAVYYSMYCCFSVLIVLRSVLSRHYDHLIDWRLIGLILLALYIVGFVLMLSGRGQIVALGAIIFTGIIWVFYQRKKLWQGILLTLAAAGLLLAGILFNPVNKNRFQEAINYNNEYGIEKSWGGRALRLLKWDCALTILKSEWLGGVGTGDVQDQLQACYQEKNYVPLLLNNARYNAHNQFFQTWLGLGVLGLAFFVAILAQGFYLSFIRKDYLYTAFLVLFLAICLTESTLAVQKGIVFFCFFNSLFLFKSNKEAAS